VTPLVSPDGDVCDEMSDGATETLKQRSATTARLTDFVEPMKAKFVGSMPSCGDWIYEIKFNGYRALALRGGSGLSRNEKARKSQTDDDVPN
jgi:ATP-dependent DNA ligase